MRRLFFGLALMGFAVMVAGCATHGISLAPLVFGLLSLFALGCAQQHGLDDSGTDAPFPDEDAFRPDGGRDSGGGGGHYERCCEGIGPDGRGMLSTCFCPGGYSCNYGLGLNDCGDGTCAYGGPDACGPDAGALDAGVAPDVPEEGTYEPCCEFDDTGTVGTISVCFCPADTECNYGLFTACGDDTCVVGRPCP